MRDLSLTISGNFSKKRPGNLVSTRVLNLSMLSAIIFFGLLYLFQVNSMGTKGYEIRRLEQQVRQVESEQKNLQIKASDLQSIDRIQSNAQSLNFVPATNVTYLKDSDFALK